jgi:hypothetical protein
MAALPLAADEFTEVYGHNLVYFADPSFANILPTKFQGLEGTIRD